MTTRAVLVAMTHALLDNTGGTRWTEPLVSQTLSLIHSRGWRRLLNANRSLRLATRTVSQDATGLVALTALSDLSIADRAQRLYKVLGAAQGVIRYQPAEFMDMPLASAQFPTVGSYTFYRTTSAIQFRPAQASATMSVWVNHLPTPIASLSGDAIEVEWPDDYEMILAWEAAARLAAVGAAETDITGAFTALANEAWLDLLADTARFTTDPLFIQAGDASSDWGSV